MNSNEPLHPINLTGGIVCGFHPRAQVAADGRVPVGAVIGLSSGREFRQQVEHAQIVLALPERDFPAGRSPLAIALSPRA